MDQMRTGRFIRQLRRERGWTQSEFAERLNISEKTVSKWETGRGMPELSLLLPVSKAVFTDFPRTDAENLHEGKRNPMFAYALHSVSLARVQFATVLRTRLTLCKIVLSTHENIFFEKIFVKRSGR